MESYPAIYSDINGHVTTTIVNDGSTLKTTLRGVEFTGRSFDQLDPSPKATPEQLRPFSLQLGSLCSCRMECRIPVTIDDSGQLNQGILLVEVVLGAPTANGGLDREHLKIDLEYSGRRFPGPGTSGWFEDELLAIQSSLPEGVHLRACIGCLFSDYSPGGHGMFGDMVCFRSNKEEYLRVRSKAEFWPVLALCDRSVQETFVCEEFCLRRPGTGYRG